MQQFFLFCTMLSVASEAFSKELRGNQISAGVKRKFSRFAPKREYPNPRRFMFEEDPHLPMFFVPSLRHVPDCGAPLGFPLRRRLSKRDHFGRRRLLRRRKNTSSSRQTFQDRFFTRPFDVAASYFSNPPQYFESRQLPGRDSPFDPNLNSVFGDFCDPRRSVTIRYPNQYIVCVYPVFNDKRFRLKKRTFRVLNKRRFSPLNGQYPANLDRRRCKNKRSTNTTAAPDETATETGKQVVTSEKLLENPTTPSLPSYTDLDYFDGLENQNPNPFLSSFPRRPSFRSQYSPLSFSSFYTSPLDVTRPSVPLPKITFKYPYDPEIYESSLRSDLSLLPAPQKKESLEPEGEEEVEPKKSAPPDLAKLKAMLEEVESVLKDDGKKTCTEKKGKKEEKEEKEKDDKEEKEECGEPEDKKGKKNKTKKTKEKKTKKKKNEKSKTYNSSDVTHESLKQKIDNVAIPILSQISRELGKLSRQTPAASDRSSNATKTDKSTSGQTNQDKSKQDKKVAGGRCSADGTWTSTVLGMEMTFTTMPNLILKVKITNKKDGVINSKWSIHGLTLSKNGGPLMLAAVYPQKRQIASFIGQCKMCRNQDLIFGSWTIYTCMGKFSDLWRSVETKLDVLRKEKGTA